MLTLKNWRLQKNWLECLIASGEVLGHYRLEDGKYIYTSCIVKIYVWDNIGYILETFSGSLYQVYESEMSEDNIMETKKLIEEFGTIEDDSIIEKLGRANEKFLQKSN